MAAMDHQFDLVIVGTGVTSAVASRCREAGWTVGVPARQLTMTGPRSCASSVRSSSHGRARFVGPTTLAVGADRLTGRRVLIAAGATPIPLSFLAPSD